MAAKTLEKNAGIAIVAAGTAGMAAAIQAAERGGSVIVLEKTSSAGGTARMGQVSF